MTTPTEPQSDSSSEISRAKHRLIRYPRFQELHEMIRTCQELSKTSGEPQCMTLEGVTGAGKSTLVRTYAEAFPQVLTEKGKHIPVLYLETPSPVSVKGLAIAMLRSLGDPAASHGALWSLDERLINFLRQCQVELVILDDFQHAYHSETPRALQIVSDWLKTIIKAANVPVLAVGVDCKIDLILKGNSQLSRLFAVRETLRPFLWDESKPKTIELFSKFVSYAEKEVGLSLTSEVPRREMLFRLHYATGGVVGYIMNLLRSAALEARRRGREELDLPSLSKAFRRGLQLHLSLTINPFDDDPQATFVPPQPPDPVEPKGKKKGRRSPSLNTVLSTG